MTRMIKWSLVVGLAIIFLIIAALLLIPHFVDIQQYKPLIEKKISAATGRSFSINGALDLYLFPKAGISFSNLHLGSPAGFEEKDFIFIEAFEARVDMPTLILSFFKDVRVTRFILKNPEIILVQKKDISNWEGIGNGRKSVPSITEDEAKDAKPEFSLPVDSFNVDEFSISGGSLTFIDQVRNKTIKISGLNLRLDDFSLENPVHINCSAKLDGHPVSLKGYLGPVGKQILKGKIPFDLSATAANHLNIKINGYVVDPVAATARAEISLRISPFSPRKLCRRLGIDFPLATSDPEVLNLAALTMNLKGNTHRISVSNGLLKIDSSKLEFSGRAEDISKPDLNFDLTLDQIDLDRYLPPEQKRAGPRHPVSQKKEEYGADASRSAKPDYSFLRKLVLQGRVLIGRLKVGNVNVKDFNLLISGKDGIFKINPLTMNLYQGALTAVGHADMQKDVPEGNLTLDVKNLNTGGLLDDIFEKDIIQGNLNTTLNLKVRGSSPDEIKKNLNGSGELELNNVALKGIDLTAMVKNTKSAFTGLAEGKEESVTKLGKIFSSFTIIDGIVKISDTESISHDLRLKADGRINLVQETLDLRVTPFLLKKDKNIQKNRRHSEYLIPVLITGNFAAPEFRPDFKKVINKELENRVFESSGFKKIFKDEDLKPLEEPVKELLKGIFN